MKMKLRLFTCDIWQVLPVAILEFFKEKSVLEATVILRYIRPGIHTELHTTQILRLSPYLLQITEIVEKQ